MTSAPAGLNRGAAAADAEPGLEVVLCTYNGERFIAEQLSSILAQTTPVNLISVYDDCSSDATFDIVQSHAGAVAAIGVRLRAVRQPRNVGYAQNFAHGIAESRGDVLLLCDQDDIWEPNKVERLVSELRSSACAIVFSDGVLIDSEGRRLAGGTVLERHGLSRRTMRQFHRDTWRLLMRRNYLNGAAMALRREAALAALPIPDEFPHDYWLALSATATNGGIACVEETLYRYRQHTGNVIGARKQKLRHQLASIWRNPGVTRRLELQRTRRLLMRLPLETAARELTQQKLAWLTRVCEERHVFRRAQNILACWWRGDYARFGASHALLRDCIALIHIR